MPLLDVKNLSVTFDTDSGPFVAVDGVSFSIEAGESFCIVGESGSGKSVTALSLAQLLPSPPASYSGEIQLDGKNVRQLSTRELRKIRGGVISYVFQEPSSSLNPLFRIENQILEALRLHRPEAATRAEVIRLLQCVKIPAAETRMRDYPHQMSGGMQQRVMIAMALASRPKLLVADEPTTALDVTVQAQILELLLELKTSFGMSLLLITHNLGIVREVADRVAVMYAGQIVEMGSTAALLERPLHPYTAALLNSVPRLHAHEARMTAIPGQVPGRTLPSGCRFHPRCPVARADCSAFADELLELEPNRWVRCRYAGAGQRN